MKQDYLKAMLETDKLCDDFKEDILNTFFKNKAGEWEKPENIEYYFCWTPRYSFHLDPIRKLIEVSDLIGIKPLETNKEHMMNRINLLKDPIYSRDHANFENLFNDIKEVFVTTKNEIREKLSILKSEEKDRLNEAVHCFLEYCYYSTIIMSVSAIEFRLLNLMSSVNPQRAQQINLEELTLGQLIREYLENKEAYKNVIPEKYQPLLQLCNTYRILSVHPKKEEITRGKASSILNLTFIFLLDKKLYGKSI